MALKIFAVEFTEHRNRMKNVSTELKFSQQRQTLSSLRRPGKSHTNVSIYYIVTLSCDDLITQMLLDHCEMQQAFYLHITHPYVLYLPKSVYNYTYYIFRCKYAVCFLVIFMLLHFFLSSKAARVINPSSHS